MYSVFLVRKFLRKRYSCSKEKNIFSYNMQGFGHFFERRKIQPHWEIYDKKASGGPIKSQNFSYRADASRIKLSVEVSMTTLTLKPEAICEIWDEHSLAFAGHVVREMPIFEQFVLPLVYLRDSYMRACHKRIVGRNTFIKNGKIMKKREERRAGSIVYYLSLGNIIQGIEDIMEKRIMWTRLFDNGSEGQQAKRGCTVVKNKWRKARCFFPWK